MKYLSVFMILACSLGIAFQAVAEPEKAAAEKRTVSDGKEIRIDPSTVTITGETDKSPLSYAPGEPMVFTLRLHFKLSLIHISDPTRRS